MTNLGWMNNETSWTDAKVYTLLENCKASKHKRTDTDESERGMGSKHHVVCTLCDFEYFYDSSD